jgi:hypothetical protein
MKKYRRSISPLVGVLACVLSWSAAPVAAAVPAEREVRLEAAPKPKAPARTAAKPAVTREVAATNREDGTGCRRLSRSRPLRLNLKPETDILDLVAWMSSITCRQFLVPGTVLASPKKVTVFAPELITPEGASRLFLSALDSVGLTVQESGRFLRIIETSKAKNSALPLYGFEGELLTNDARQESSDGQPAPAKPAADEVSP